MRQCGLRNEEEGGVQQAGRAYHDNEGETNLYAKERVDVYSAMHPPRPVNVEPLARENENECEKRARRHQQPRARSFRPKAMELPLP